MAHHDARILAFTLFLTSLVFAPPPGRAQAATLDSTADAAAGEVTEVVGHVRYHQKISQTAGGFGGVLADFDSFGHSVASVSDLDHDGVGELAVGAPFDDDGGNDRGAVWLLFPHPNATVKTHQKISDIEGGFTGGLDDVDAFGSSVASIGDLDGDGIADLAVGAPGDDDGGDIRGAVWLLFLHPNGTVKGHQKISDTEGGFTGGLADFDEFGSSVTSVGDLDGDGIVDLAVGARTDDDGGSARGAVWLLFLHPNGTVKGHQKISATSGGFNGNLEDGDRFGSAVASMGDLDGNGAADLVVGASGDGADRGAVWVVFLEPGGTVQTEQKINDSEGGFTGTLDDNDRFGGAVAPLGDVDCDRTHDVAVGASQDGDGGMFRGAVWILFLRPDGTVRMHTKISDTSGGFNGTLHDSDRFGSSAASLGDLDGDGNPELAVGARFDDDGGGTRGAVWNLFLDGNGCAHPLFSDGFESGDTGAWSGAVSWTAGRAR